MITYLHIHMYRYEIFNTTTSFNLHFTEKGTGQKMGTIFHEPIHVSIFKHHESNLNANDRN